MAGFAQKLLRLPLFAALCCCVAAAWAAPVVSSQLVVDKVVQGVGGESLKPATAAQPGDVLQYRATYANAGDHAAGHLVADLPIPAGTALQEQGIVPSGASATLDGNTYAPMPLKRKVIGKDGKVHEERVPLVEIRGLRWNLGNLEPGQSRVVQLRVHVNVATAVSQAVSSIPSGAASVRVAP